MTFNKQKIYLFFIALIAGLALMGCNIDGVDPDVDTTAPTVTSTSPLDSAIDVAINSSITAAFSEAMDSETIVAANFTVVDDGATPVSGTVSYDAATMTASFNPAADLAAGTEYTVTITTGAKDLAGNALAANKTWTFTTGSTADTTDPTVTSTSPANTATGVGISSDITATFSEKMDPTTIVAANFTLADGANPVSGTVSYDIGNTAAIFTPDSNLNASTEYTATVTTDVTDSAGNAMATEKVWTFNTATAASAAGPPPVNLGTAGNYAILAKTAINNSPTSAITGDLGLSPAATSYITGFSLTNATGYATSDQVTGFIYAADMAVPTPTNLTTAVSDMEAAYNDAAGRTASSIVLDSEIGGQTKTPGLYVATGDVGISSTNVTISGNANDVWIFQIPGNLTVGSGAGVTLSGNAQAKNIFWQVAGEVTVGTTAHFEGILLSKTGITLGTDASMNGRALAQTAVILDSNEVVEPAD